MGGGAVRAATSGGMETGGCLATGCATAAGAGAAASDSPRRSASFIH